MGGKMGMKHKSVLVNAVAALALVAIPLKGMADQAPAGNAPGSESDSLALQEIVVTATRREQSVEKVPISIQALSQDAMTERGIKDIADIANVTPGLQFALPIGIVPTITAISIRGLNTDTGASTVGLYVDDTPIQVRLSALGNVGSPIPALFDLNRVEVERGPQGTLFGASAEAGAVRFITNQPSLTQASGFSHVEFATTEGGAGSQEVGVAYGAPIVTDELGYRNSFWDRHDGGYVNRLDPLTGETTDHNSNGKDTFAIHAALAWQPVDGLKITPSALTQWTNVDNTSIFYGYLSNASAGRFNDGTLTPAPWHDHFYLPSVKVEAKLPFADLTSTTSYMYRELDAKFDTSESFYGNVTTNGKPGYGSPLGPDFVTSPEDSGPSTTGQTVRGETEEVRLSSNDPEARLTWVAGVFLDHRTQFEFQQTRELAIDPTGAPVFNFTQLITDTQKAIFAQGDLHLTSQWILTLGGRVAFAKVDQFNTNGPGVVNTGELAAVASPTVHETPWTPRVAISYQADPDNLFYAAIAKGFRVGGGNAPLPDVCKVTPPATYDSDYVWSYEIGSKDRLFDGHLQLDTSAFYINWKKIQQLIPVPACGLLYTANTGSAVSEGFDLALQSIITERFGIDLNLGYVNAHYNVNVYDSNGSLLIEKNDVTGLPPQVLSPWSATVQAHYKVPLPNGDSVRGNVEYQYQSHNSGPYITQIPGPSYAPLLVGNPATSLVNLRAVYKHGPVDVALFVNNVANNHPLLGAFTNGELVSYSTFRPRTVGVSANYAF
jgi:iron complex outermembrane receptor protein